MLSKEEKSENIDLKRNFYFFQPENVIVHTAILFINLPIGQQ